MKKTKALIVFFCIAMLIATFSGCKSKENNIMNDEKLKNFIIDKSEKIDFSIISEYSIDTLNNYFGEYSAQERGAFNKQINIEMLQINKVNSTFPIQILRSNENSCYSIYKVKEGGLYYVFWTKDDSDNIIVSDTFYIVKLKDHKDFDDLEIGKSTCAEVFAIDSATELVLILSSKICSYNLLNDGTLMEIEYDFNEFKDRQDLVVKSKKNIPATSSSATKLSVILPNDLP